MAAYLLLTAPAGDSGKDRSAFTVQALMFVPIVPMLVATGALAAHGRLREEWALAALSAGLAAGDFLSRIGALAAG